MAAQLRQQTNGMILFIVVYTIGREFGFVEHSLECLVLGLSAFTL